MHTIAFQSSGYTTVTFLFPVAFYEFFFSNLGGALQTDFESGDIYPRVEDNISLLQLLSVWTSLQCFMRMRMSYGKGLRLSRGGRGLEHELHYLG